MQAADAGLSELHPMPGVQRASRQRRSVAARQSHPGKVCVARPQRLHAAEHRLVLDEEQHAVGLRQLTRGSGHDLVIDGGAAGARSLGQTPRRRHDFRLATARGFKRRGAPALAGCKTKRDHRRRDAEHADAGGEPGRQRRLGRHTARGTRPARGRVAPAYASTSSFSIVTGSSRTRTPVA